MHSSITYVLYSLLLITMNSTTLAETGDELFGRYCAACHHTPDTVRKSQTILVNALTPGVVRKHKFTLSETEKKLLIQYLSVATN